MGNTPLQEKRKTKSSLLRHMASAFEPISYRMDSGSHTVTAYAYAKVYPKYTYNDILWICEDLRVKPEMVNFENCYENHVSSTWLKSIIKILKEGNHFYVSKISDLGGTPIAIANNLKKIKEKGVYLAICREDAMPIELDFSPNEYPFNPDDIEFSEYLKNYTEKLYPILLELIQSHIPTSVTTLQTNKVRPLSIKDFSDDFIKFYFTYIKLKSEKSRKVGSMVENYAKSTGISPSTAYKRIAWLTAHPTEVAARYDKINIHNNNSVDLKNIKEVNAILFFHNHMNTDYISGVLYRFVISLSKKNAKEINYQEYTNERTLFYYKLTGSTSFSDILDFCIFYGYENKISIKSVADFFTMSEKIVWEYSYPSKDINTKLNAILESGLISYGSLYVQDIHHLGSTSERIVKTMVRLLDMTCEISTPNLRLENYDIECLVSLDKDLNCLPKKPDGRKNNGRPPLSLADLPPDFKSFYYKYRKAKAEHLPLTNTVTEYANKHNYAPKTVYSWIYRADRGKL